MSITVAWVSTLFLLAAQPTPKAELSELRVSLDGSQVVVALQLNDGFSEDLLDRIESGLPTGFTYDLELFRDHKRWFDDKLDRTRLQVVAMYDGVTREYLVNFKQDGKLVESRTVKDLEELETTMTQVQSLRAFETADLPPHWRLLVRAQAELGSKMLFSLVPSTVRTDTVESRKFRPPARP